MKNRFPDATIHTIDECLDEVFQECIQQNRKWGEQNHPDGTSELLFTELADIYRARCDANAVAGTITWRDILLEEFWETSAEEDPAKIRAELIQVAAVAVQWALAIDRRNK